MERAGKPRRPTSTSCTYEGRRLNLWGPAMFFGALVLAAPTLTAKRGWAITLRGCEPAKRARLVAGVRSADADLEATVEWLLAA